MIRLSFTNSFQSNASRISFDVFHERSKSKKVIIHTKISSSDEDENEHDEPKLQSINKSVNDQIKDIYM